MTYIGRESINFVFRHTFYEKINENETRQFSSRKVLYAGIEKISPKIQGPFGPLALKKLQALRFVSGQDLFFKYLLYRRR